MNPENFEQFNKEVEKFKELKEKFEAWVGKDTIKNYGEAAKFSERIKKEYSDHDSYMFFHALGGSGVDYSKCVKPDFPGDYSVEQFIEDKYNSLK